jgi:hypothetical protein
VLRREHPAATFAIRIEGESMTGAGIFPGDIAVVDRAREPVNGGIVLALRDGAFTVKRYRTKDGAVWLQAENPAFPDIPIADGAGLGGVGRHYAQHPHAVSLLTRIGITLPEMQILFLFSRRSGGGRSISTSC